MKALAFFFLTVLLTVAGQANGQEFMQSSTQTSALKADALATPLPPPPPCNFLLIPGSYTTFNHCLPAIPTIGCETECDSCTVIKLQWTGNCPVYDFKLGTDSNDCFSACVEIAKPTHDAYRGTRETCAKKEIEFIPVPPYYIPLLQGESFYIKLCGSFPMTIRVKTKDCLGNDCESTFTI